MITTIFFDLDGLLCDFAGGSAKVHGKQLCYQTAQWDYFKEWGMSPTEFWAPLACREFWANLEPLADGLELLHFCEEYYDPNCITILSSGLCPESVDGKRDWLRKYLPAYEKKAVFGSEKHHCSAPCKVLIDDYDPNIEKWQGEPYCGQGVLVPRSWNSRKGDMLPGGRFDPDAVFREVQEKMQRAIVDRKARGE